MKEAVAKRSEADIHSAGPARVLILCAAAILTGCADRAPAPRAETPPACDNPAASQVVEALGRRMKNVSLLAPDTLVARQLRAAYATLVTPALLEQWVADPRHAPGREVSSPWPEQIQIDSIVASGAAGCRVFGSIRYVTSVELASGAAAARVPMTMELTSDAGWRVSSYRAASFSAAPPPPPPPAAAPAAAAADTVTADTDPAGVIRRYYAAINARDFRRAYLLWGNEGMASGKTFETFAAGFAGTSSVAVEIGDVGRVEGAAGSRYVEVPVVLRAVTTDGGAQRFEGSYILRRTVVDGASPAQRRWHLYSARITPSV